MSRAALAVVALVAAGCRPAPPAPAAITFRDPEGRPVTIATLPAKRIVSTMQSATEWLLALGAADHLVARTDFDRQPAIAHLPSLGGGLEIAAEAVAALRPDVVLGWRIRSSADLARALAPFGIPVVAVEATDTAEAFRQLAAIASLVGLRERGDSLAAALRHDLDRLRSDACREGGRPASVLVVVSTDPPMTAGGGTWMSELLGAACLRNTFDDLEAAWPTIAMEAIAARQPEWLLTSRGDAIGDALAELRAKPAWRDLDAVRAGRVIELDPDLLSRVGPRMAEWVRAVRAEKGRVTGDR